MALRLAVAGGLPFPILSARSPGHWHVRVDGRRGVPRPGPGRVAKSTSPANRPLLRRHGFWLIVLTAADLLAAAQQLLAQTRKETHYGSRARCW